MLKSVLLVDLDGASGRDISDFLYTRGVRVLRCDNVPRLETALKGAWDLVLTEWEFYHLGGASLISLLRPQRQPVLVYSWKESGGISAQALQAGAKGVFSKRSRGDLVEEISRQLNGNSDIPALLH
jgi:DNA-binding NarL/FixJ family response regulator